MISYGQESEKRTGTLGHTTVLLRLESNIDMIVYIYTYLYLHLYLDLHLYLYLY